jgi:EmrB/QacA subfamily drug resistance transporter
MRTTTYDRRWLILAVILAAECMDLLDATIVNVAAPAIRADLHTTSTALQWIVGGYALAVACGLILGGRLGDLFGRRQMFVIGTAGFTVASLLCAVAPTSGALIGFRLLQGAAAAVMLPQGLGVIREVFPPKELGQAFGIFGPVIGLAAVIGPILGGVLVDWDLANTGWRLIFLINLPLGVAAAIGAWALLPRTAPVHASSRLDVVGAVLSGAAMVLVVYPLIQGRALGWPAWVYGMIAVSVVLFGAFWWQQKRQVRLGRDPLVLPSVFGHRGYAAGLLVLLVFFAGMGGLLLTASVFLQFGQGFSPTHTGVAFIPMSLGMAVGAGLSGAVLGPRFGRLVIQAGAVVTIGGWLLVLHAVYGGGVVGAVDLLPGLLVAGLGMGLCVAPLFDIILASVTDAETGSASGVLNAGQQLAGAVGVAVLGTIFFAAIGSVGFAGAFERTLWVQIGCLGAMLLLTPLMPRIGRGLGEGALATEPEPALVGADAD